jgi:hypothetical protein
MDRMSFGLLLDGALDQQTFRPGQYELRGKMAAVPEAQAMPAARASEPSAPRAANSSRGANRREKDLFDADFDEP